ncbi:exodeoxyribonuclease VII small subunit [Alkanindiges sp. WGS2144]|uniref:exodeoxyribonuclease VII small subunit n=1 Tax=Alkanindiges sp. WGS2144 TaxID=3366808 RepID=UPI0037506C7A
MTDSTPNFKQAFDTLKQNAATLEEQQEPDIDQLMVLIEESMQAYKICKQRIEAVQQALNRTFEGE